MNLKIKKIRGKMKNTVELNLIIFGSSELEFLIFIVMYFTWLPAQVSYLYRNSEVEEKKKEKV